MSMTWTGCDRLFLVCLVSHVKCHMLWQTLNEDRCEDGENIRAVPEKKILVDRVIFYV
jgi:hypothetical protein